MAQYFKPVETEAFKYVKEELLDAGSVLKGACDIIAEWVNEDVNTRQTVRNIFAREAVITSKVVKGGKEDQGENTETISTSPPCFRVVHRTGF